jgi:phosphoribulokinase
MSKRVDHPIILGIVGDSASGKSTLSIGVAQILGEEHCTVLCTDDYHRYSRAERAAAGLSALDPRANHIDILEQHLRLLRNGEPILKPIYDHQRGTLQPPQYVKPKQFVIAEGLLGYTTRGMRDCYDVKIYLDPEEELTFADIVIRFQRPGDANGSDTRLDVRHILRPTLPHPDFTPLFDGSSNAGLHLELARDRDGKPVDVLEINGNISDKRAERIEDLLWNLIPEAGHLRDQVGRIDLANGAKSHPLALTQLLVGYHAVKAAMGVRAY